MSKRGAKAQAEEKHRIVRALRRTNKTPKGLPGSSSRKKLKRFLGDDPLTGSEER